MKCTLLECPTGEARHRADPLQEQGRGVEREEHRRLHQEPEQERHRPREVPVRRLRPRRLQADQGDEAVQDRSGS